MSEKVIPTIICPVCGQEYLPSEIYLPTQFFNNPGEIIKNKSGKIEFYTGKDMDLDEEYICDGCGSKLLIKANISFTVENEEVDSEEYVSTFNKADKIKLIPEELF